MSAIVLTSPPLEDIKTTTFKDESDQYDSFFLGKGSISVEMGLLWHPYLAGHRLENWLSGLEIVHLMPKADELSNSAHNPEVVFHSVHKFFFNIFQNPNDRYSMIRILKMGGILAIIGTDQEKVFTLSALSYYCVGNSFLITYFATTKSCENIGLGHMLVVLLAKTFIHKNVTKSINFLLMANEKENKLVFEWYTKRGFVENELSSDTWSDFKQLIEEEYQCDELKLLVLENVEQKLKLPQILPIDFVNRRFYPNPIFELTLPEIPAPDAHFVRVSIPEYVYAQLSPGACSWRELYHSLDNKQLLYLGMFFAKQRKEENLLLREREAVGRKGQIQKHEPFGFIGYQPDPMRQMWRCGRMTWSERCFLTYPMVTEPALSIVLAYLQGDPSSDFWTHRLTLVPYNIGHNIYHMFDIYQRFLVYENLRNVLQEKDKLEQDFDLAMETSLFNDHSKYVLEYIWGTPKLLAKEYFAFVNTGEKQSNIFVACNICEIRSPPKPTKSPHEDEVCGYIYFDPSANAEDPIKDSSPFFFLTLAVHMRYPKNNVIMTREQMSDLRDLEKFHDFFQKAEHPVGLKLGGRQVIRNGSREFVRLTFPRNYPLKCKPDAKNKNLCLFLCFLDLCYSVFLYEVYWKKDDDDDDSKESGIIEFDQSKIVVKEDTYYIPLIPHFELENKHVFLFKKKLELLKEWYMAIYQFIDRLAEYQWGERENIREFNLFLKRPPPPEVAPTIDPGFAKSGSFLQDMAFWGDTKPRKTKAQNNTPTTATIVDLTSPTQKVIPASNQTKTISKKKLPTASTNAGSIAAAKNPPKSGKKANDPKLKPVTQPNKDGKKVVNRKRKNDSNKDEGSAPKKSKVIKGSRIEDALSLPIENPIIERELQATIDQTLLENIDEVVNAYTSPKKPEESKLVSVDNLKNTPPPPSPIEVIPQNRLKMTPINVPHGQHDKDWPAIIEEVMKELDDDDVTESDNRYESIIVEFLPEYFMLEDDNQRLSLKWEIVRKIHYDVQKVMDVDALLKHITARLEKVEMTSTLISPRDFMCDRGKGAETHKGNEFFSRLLLCIMESFDYQGLDNKKKKKLIDEVVKSMDHHGRRFMKPIDEEKKQWKVLSFIEARQKVVQKIGFFLSAKHKNTKGKKETQDAEHKSISSGSGINIQEKDVVIARGAAGKGKKGNDLFKTQFVLPHHHRNLKENTKAVTLILEEAKKDGFRFMILRPEGYHVASDLDAINKIKRFFRETQPIPDGAEVVDCTGEKAAEEFKESEEKEEQMIDVGSAEEREERRVEGTKIVEELAAPDEKEKEMNEIGKEIEADEDKIVGPKNVDELGAPEGEKDNQMKEIDSVAKETEDGRVEEPKNVEESEVSNEIEKVHVHEEGESKANDNEEKVNDEK